MAKYLAAYERGIAKGKCGAFSLPDKRWHREAIGRLISKRAHDKRGNKYTGETLLRWIEHEACEFASDVAERDAAKFYKSFEPEGCEKWLNEVDMAEEARNVG